MKAITTHVISFLRCWYFLRDKAFISLLHEAHPVVVIQRTLQVILDQVRAGCLQTSDSVSSVGKNGHAQLTIVERLSNNGDNFRSVLDNMMDLMKHACKDEMEDAEVYKQSTKDHNAEWFEANQV